MRIIQLTLTSIIYFICCNSVLKSASFTIVELITHIDIYSIVLLAIIFIPIMASILLMIFTKNQKIYWAFISILSLFSIALLWLNQKYSNLRAYNDSITIVSHWEDGMPREIKYNEYNKKNHLVYLTYHENGNINQRLEYVNGIKSGTEIFRNPNSSLKRINEYYKGELTRVADYELNDSDLNEYLPKIFEDVSQENFDDLSISLSKVISLINPCCSNNYILTSFYENGEIEKKEVYKNNQPNGEYIKFYENGKIKEEGIQIEYDKIGVWKYYDKGGKLILEETYDNTGILIEKNQK